MENETEIIPSQKKEEEVPKVEMTQVELDDLKHKAEVSSQNFERAKKAELKLKELEDNKINEIPSAEVFSEEGKAIKKLIDSQSEEISRLKEEKELDKTIAQYPMLKDFVDEFNTYKAEFPRHKVVNVAKLFLTEKGLLETTRKGLEKQTGGTKVAGASGKMTPQDAEHLMKTNFKKYQELILKGQLNIDYSE